MKYILRFKVKFYWVLIIAFFSSNSYGQQAEMFDIDQSNVKSPSSCTDQFAGTMSLGEVSAQSSQVDLDQVTYLCYLDQFIVHNSDANLTGDPNNATTPGVGYVFYDCAPTISGPELNDVLLDMCKVDDPEPQSPIKLWVYTDKVDGTALFRNANQLAGQTIPEFFNGGDPIQLFFAPLTFDDFDNNEDEDDGLCIHVNVDEAFPVVYLNPITITNYTTGIGGNPLKGSFVIEGGLSEYNGSPYKNLYIAKNGNLSSLAVLDAGEYKHGDIVTFTASEEGDYEILIQDEVSCGYQDKISLSLENKETTININFPSSTAKVGEVVCAKISVEDFISIVAFQYSISFNSHILKFTEIKNLNLEQLSEFNFVDIFADNGYITTQWYDASAIGITVPDNEVIYEICFEVVGDPGDCSVLDFNSFPTLLEVVCCEDQENLNVNINSDELCIVPDNIMDIVATSCGSSGASTGTLSFKVIGGEAPYSYTIDPLGITATLPQEDLYLDFTDLAAGTYTITVVDDDGVTSSEIIVVDNSTPIDFDININNPACYGYANGSLEVGNLTGGQPDYTYSWSNSIYNIPYQPSLGAGTYFVTVEDANGCKVTKQAVLGVDPIDIHFNVVQEASCLGVANGIVEVTASGGTPNSFLGSDNYNFNLLSPLSGKHNNVTEVVESGVAPGVYTIKVVDSKFCVATDSFEMGFQKEVVIDSYEEDGMCGEGPGFISVKAGASDGSISNYSFLLKDDSNITIPNVSLPDSMSANIDSEGTYYVTVSDAEGCKALDTFDITFGSPVGLIIVNDYNCVGGGQTTLFPSGSSPKIDWEDGSDKSIRNDLNYGEEYKLTVTDINGCELDTFVTVEPPALLLDTIKVSNVSCEGMDGEIAIEINGNPDFTWTDSNGNPYPNTPIISNLDEGYYYVTIFDPGTQCEVVDSVLVDSDGELSINPIITQNVLCHGLSTGEIQLVLMGGNTGGQYLFEWSDGYSSDMPIRSNMSAGSYQVTVTDESGCSASASIVLAEGPTIDIQINQLSEILCYGGAATIEAIASGGVSLNGNYGFEWSNGKLTGLGPNVKDTVFNMTAPGGSVIVFDEFCADTLEFTVTQPEKIILQNSSIVTDVSCYGACDGTASVDVQGGVEPYSYDWKGFFDKDNEAENLCAGWHAIEITDDNNCHQIDSIEIMQPDTLILGVWEEQTNNPSCDNTNDGVIKLEYQGGNSGSVIYTWSNTNSTSDIATGLSAGIYMATITDTNGCEDSISYTLTTAPPITANIGNIEEPNCYGETTCFNIESISGGSGTGFNFAVNNGSLIPTDTSCLKLFAGEYLVTIYDDKGCTFDTTIIIDQPEEFISSLGEDINMELGDSTQILEVQLNSGFTIDTILWESEGDFECVDDDCTQVFIYPNFTTKYMVTAINENGCESTDMIEVRVDDERRIYFPNVFSPNGDGRNDIFKPFAGDGVEKFTLFQIFDRWGNKVFSVEDVTPTTSNLDGWDGTYKGKMLDGGVYTYFVHAQFVDDNTIKYSGNVTLIR